MKLREILEPEDLAVMIGKQLGKSGMFNEIDIDDNDISLETKSGVPAKITVERDAHFVMRIYSERGDSIDVGIFSSVADIIEVFTEIEKDPKAWVDDLDSDRVYHFDDTEY